MWARERTFLQNYYVPQDLVEAQLVGISDRPIEELLRMPVTVM